MAVNHTDYLIASILLIYRIISISELQNAYIQIMIILITNINTILILIIKYYNEENIYRI